MTRFQRIDTDKQLTLHIVDKLHEIGYKRVPDLIGGDEDFIVIDVLRKEYIWCEFGVAPFCSDDAMIDYEKYSTPKSVTLRLIALGSI